MQKNGFKKAERFLTNPTIAITGPTGAGKTMGALLIATGIAKAMKRPFAVIDTENGSASLYSEHFDFDTLNITPPFTTEKYIDAINMAERGGYCALVIDSITHAWAGEGGLLEQKDLLDSRPNSNKWSNWGPIKAKDSKFKNAYLHSSIPFLIATMRSKMEYAQTEKNGNKKIEKMGMAPVQADGIEYEFSLVFDAAMNHMVEVTKDRTNLYIDKKIFKITEEIGEELVAWRASSKEKPVLPIASAQAEPPVQVHPPDDVQRHPPDSDDLASYLDDAPLTPEAMGAYQVPFGPHRGKLLNSMGDSEILAYVELVESEATKRGKAISGVVKEFVTIARAFCNQPTQGG